MLWQRTDLAGAAGEDERCLKQLCSSQNVPKTMPYRLVWSYSVETRSICPRSVIRWILKLLDARLKAVFWGFYTVEGAALARGCYSMRNLSSCCVSSRLSCYNTACSPRSGIGAQSDKQGGRPKAENEFPLSLASSPLTRYLYHLTSRKAGPVTQPPRDPRKVQAANLSAFLVARQDSNALLLLDPHRCSSQSPPSVTDTEYLPNHVFTNFRSILPTATTHSLHESHRFPPRSDPQRINTSTALATLRPPPPFRFPQWISLTFLRLFPTLSFTIEGVSRTNLA